MSAYPPPGEQDPTRGLRRTRNILIAVIVVVATLAIVGSCGVNAIRGGADGDARAYVTSHYQRDTALDESDVDAYIADGSPSVVATQISSVAQPTDQRAGDNAAGNEAGTEFLQYPGYLIGLFPYAADKTRVMVSRDYTSGYNHYHHYVGGFWVPTPDFSGSGSSNRGGGSGTGK
ncbi:DUF4247 domain-containing protein [Gordonia sp. NPDC003429]